MKKYLFLILAMTAILLAGCSSSKKETEKAAQQETEKAAQQTEQTTEKAAQQESEKAVQQETEQTTEQAAQQETEEKTMTKAADVQETETEPADGTEEKVDVDLSVMSGTIVYAEVFNMLCEPEKYMGKTVKMKGLFNVFYSEPTDTYYFACVIQDATACCSQGLEFVLEEERNYPEDYPEIGEEITVTGVFDTYKEGEDEYCTLRKAKMSA